MAGDVRIEHYAWRGGREAMLRFGTGNPQVVAIPALFEEANRTRALLVATLRQLAAGGIASLLPDLPGQGESLVEAVRLADWHEAIAAVTSEPLHMMRWRGGCLIGASMRPASCWDLSPVDGAALLRDLDRAAMIGGGNAAPPSAELVADLADAVPSIHCPRRIVRLASDPRPADRKLDAAPPWRAAEPPSDTPLAAVLAADMAGWIAACDG